MKSINARTLLFVIGLGGLLGLVGTAGAQLSKDAGPGAAKSRDLTFAVSMGAENSFEADVEGGGELGVFRLQFGVKGKTEITRDLDLAVSLGYDVDLYDFSGTTRLGGVEPWDDVHTLSLNVIGSLQLDSEWTVFGGPVFQLAREDDADWDDSFIGGGVIGATYEVGPDLTVGGGIGIVTQLEDDSRFFPVLVLNWELSDRWRVTSQTTGASGLSGLELVYDFADDWEAGIGVSLDFRRFRLDDTGMVPGGVGEETRTPILARLSYTIDENINLDLYAGVAYGTELELHDLNGVEVGAEDVDPAAMVGFRLNLCF